MAPIKHSPPHTIISDSPTKGRIKSKKRNRAPPPPVNTDATFSDGYITDQHRISSEGTRAVHWGASDTHSRPSSQVSSYKSKGKGRKIGLFKKKNDSRKSDNESSFTDDQSKSKPRSALMSNSDKDDKRERARSVDCLQHELRRSSDLVTISTTIGRGSNSDESSSNERDSSRRSQTIERESRRIANADLARRLSTTMERNPKTNERDARQMFKDGRSNSILEERRSFELQANRNYLNKPIIPSNSLGVHRDAIPLGRRASSSNSRHDRSLVDKAFDEWEQAEKEELRRKRISDNMKHELLTAANNLKKSSEISQQGEINERNIEAHIVSRENKINSSRQSEIIVDEKDLPKTFFFGMEPDKASDKVNKKIQIPIQTEAVRIEGATVGYSKRNSEVIEQSRSRSRENISRVSNHSDKVVPPQEETNDIDKFVVAMGKRKHNFVRDDLFASPVRRDDGGYHSRQNSGSFHLENENPSDEDRSITVNLRPILPKRQREIPRFSPNAAWRFLGEEPFLSNENNLNESRSSEEVDTVFEDKIRGYSRPVAPPRGSGEKSADSGISGDAGSPGPMPEFEPIIPSTSIKIVTNGPLAASSPVTSGRSELRRAWTPAQDLDDNSLDGSGENQANKAMQGNMLTPPKLTSRANMFTLFGVQNDNKLNGNCGLNEERKSTQVLATKYIKTVEDSTQTMSNFKKLQRSVSGNIHGMNNSPVYETSTKINVTNVQTDKWRDNWSMTRSIPNSLNNVDERDLSCKDKFDCSKSDLNPSPHNRLHVAESLNGAARTRAAGQQNGHIMYLPEYNSRKILSGQNSPTVGEIRSRDLNSSRHLNRSHPLDDHTSHQLQSANEISPASLPNFFPLSTKIGGRLKKGKKFSYQSTVRVLEQKKIEAKLNREIAAKEQQRLQEASAMRQVSVAHLKYRK